MDLFRESRQKNLDRVAPLAVRMRPRSLEEFVGQQHFLGPGKLLRRMLEADRLTSVSFYGPPGTGKTTLAQVIRTLVRRAIADPERGYGTLNIAIDEDALNLWATMSDGDARRALMALEVAVLSTQSETTDNGQQTTDQSIHITLDIAEQSIQRK